MIIIGYVVFGIFIGMSIGLSIAKSQWPKRERYVMHREAIERARRKRYAEVENGG